MFSLVEYLDVFNQVSFYCCPVLTEFTFCLFLVVLSIYSYYENNNLVI